MNSAPDHAADAMQPITESPMLGADGESQHWKAQSGNVAPIHRRETDGPLIVVRLTNFTAPGASAPGQHEEK